MEHIHYVFKLALGNVWASSCKENEKIGGKVYS